MFFVKYCNQNMESITVFYLFLLPEYTLQLLTHKIAYKIPVSQGFNSWNMTRLKSAMDMGNRTESRSAINWGLVEGLTDEEENSASECFEEPKLWCNRDTKYRTIDGSCNNLNMRSWGMANTALLRIAPANYADGTNLNIIIKVNRSTGAEGVKTPRKSKTGVELPHPTTIVSAIFRKGESPSEMFTLFLMQFGQVIARDVTGISSKTKENGELYDCCVVDHSLKDACLPLQILTKDDRYLKYKETCYNFVRSKTTDDLLCPQKPINQLLKVTSFLDASFLYGSTRSILWGLRTKHGGRLRVQTDMYQRPFPPLLNTTQDHCHITENVTPCYEFGDFRVNQNLGFAVSTVSLLRLHNFLCDTLQWLNPRWNDEHLFREARRILIAMYQHVVYYEYLPIIIGKKVYHSIGAEGIDYANKYGLLPEEKGYSKHDYNSNINPTTVNSFAAGAFRTLHRLMRNHFSIANEKRKFIESIRVSNTIFNVSILQQGNKYDGILLGLITDASQKLGRSIAFELGLAFSPDLISIDIQRGRDHGLPTYNQFAQICGLTNAKEFEDYKHIMDSKVIGILSKLYKQVDDIDLYVGLSLEIPSAGSLVGPVTQCIIAEAFYRWKYGDRFFYEHGNLPGSFTPNQLRELRKTTMSLIICLTSDNIQNIQSNSFYKPSDLNQLLPCDIIPRPDFSWWKESQDDK